MGNALRRAAVQAQASNAVELFKQALAQPTDGGPLLGKVLGRQGEGGAHGRDLMGGQGSGTQAPFMSSTMDLCL
ncbi:hypothetical protein D3C78_1929010 [compost metagenome]